MFGTFEHFWNLAQVNAKKELPKSLVFDGEFAENMFAKYFGRSKENLEKLKGICQIFARFKGEIAANMFGLWITLNQCESLRSILENFGNLTFGRWITANRCESLRSILENFGNLKFSKNLSWKKSTGINFSNRQF